VKNLQPLQLEILRQFRDLGNQRIGHGILADLTIFQKDHSAQVGGGRNSIFFRALD
jgi:hypothetical protein